PGDPAEHVGRAAGARPARPLRALAFGFAGRSRPPTPRRVPICRQIMARGFRGFFTGAVAAARPSRIRSHRTPRLGRLGWWAGLLIQVPQALLGRRGVAVLFEWDQGARDLVAEAFAESGLELQTWRPVPTNPAALGDFARGNMPAIWHGLVARPDLPDHEFEALLYVARRRAERLAEQRSVSLYLPSCSCRTLVYKGLMAGPALADFYPHRVDEAV